MSLLASAPENRRILAKFREDNRHFFRRRLLTYIRKLEEGYYNRYFFFKYFCEEETTGQIVFAHDEYNRKNGLAIMYEDILEEELYNYKQRKSKTMLNNLCKYL